MVDRNNLSNTFTFITGSLLPQGDLFLYLSILVQTLDLQMFMYHIKIQQMFILSQLFTDHLVVVMLVQMNGIIGTDGIYASASYMIQITYTHW